MFVDLYALRPNFPRSFVVAYVSHLWLHPVGSSSQPGEQNYFIYWTHLQRYLISEFLAKAVKKFKEGVKNMQSLIKNVDISE